MWHGGLLRHGGPVRRPGTVAPLSFGHACACSTQTKAVGGDVTELVCETSSSYLFTFTERIELMHAPRVVFSFSHAENDRPAGFPTSTSSACSAVHFLVCARRYQTRFTHTRHMRAVPEYTGAVPERPADSVARSRSHSANEPDRLV